MSIARGVTAGAALVLAALGCGKRPSPTLSAPSAVAAVSAPLPADHALPGELAEGTETAFGLPIPRRMRVTGRYPDAVFATGELPPELVANYVRQRVIAARIETGPERTVFNRATTQRDPGKFMRIDVIGRGDRAELFVRDETQPPAAEEALPEERWRELGLSPKARPLDPTRLQ